MDVSIMIEGQMGLTWARWRRLVSEVERLGFAGLYRSDHFVNPSPPDDESLELIAALTYLADRSERLRFGAMVVPVSFRDPVMYARQGAALSDLSGGRYLHGLGAGWMTREHDAYGYMLGDIPTRVARLEEALEVTRLLLRSEEPVSFDGRFYRLTDATPATPRAPATPICIGGKGPRRVLPLVARYADVWNATGLAPAEFAERSEMLDVMLAAEGRAPADVRRTIMTGVFVGDGPTLERRLARFAGRLGDASSQKIAASLRERGVIAGTPDEARAQLEDFAKAGCEEIMLQWLWLDDIDGLAALADALR